MEVSDDDHAKDNLSASIHERQNKRDTFIARKCTSSFIVNYLHHHATCAWLSISRSHCPLSYATRAGLPSEEGPFQPALGRLLRQARRLHMVIYDYVIKIPEF